MLTSPVTMPIELTPPDIEPYRLGNTGIDYVHTFDSGQSGPHVMISAIVHGNELCGAIALDFLLQQSIRPLCGRLSLAFVNVAAYQQFDPQQPNASRFVEEDFNHVWASEVLTGPRDSIELTRARELRPLLDTVDRLLDIHSMQHECAPLLMCGSTAKGRALAQAVPFAGHIVSDQGHIAGTRMRDYAAFGLAESQRNALLVECGQHWQASSARVAKDTALQFLHHCGLIDTALLQQHLSTPNPPASLTQLIEVTGPVTITSDSFRFTQAFMGLEVVAQQGTLIALDGAIEVRTPYDNCVLIMPSMRLNKGQTAVRLGRFVT